MALRIAQMLLQRSAYELLYGAVRFAAQPICVGPLPMDCLESIYCKRPPSVAKRADGVFFQRYRLNQQAVHGQQVSRYREVSHLPAHSCDAKGELFQHPYDLDPIASSFTPYAICYSDREKHVPRQA